MSDDDEFDNLGEFLNERVLPTRQMVHVQFPLDSDQPMSGVLLDSSQDGITIAVLPTVAEGLLHIEVHFFVDGERAVPEINIPDEPPGMVEITLRRE